MLSVSDTPQKEKKIHPVQWNLKYKRDKTAVDSAMTEFLGAKTIRYGDGWVVKMGTFLGDAGAQYDHYYYLTMEPLE